jgi:hypothetical protein
VCMIETALATNDARCEIWSNSTQRDEPRHVADNNVRYYITSHEAGAESKARYEGSWITRSLAPAKETRYSSSVFIVDRTLE